MDQSYYTSYDQLPLILRVDDLGATALNNRLTSMKSPYRISKAPDGYSLRPIKDKEEARNG